MDPHKRAIGNAMQVSFTDGISTPRVAVVESASDDHAGLEALPVPEFMERWSQ
jgi:hypothetical protein